MNDLRFSRSPRRADDHVDGMLRAFFRAEVPDPWPVIKKPEAPPQTLPIRPWWRRPEHLVLAASILLLVVGYLALAGSFPRQQRRAPSAVTPLERDIGAPLRPVHHKATNHPGQPVSGGHQGRSEAHEP